MLNDFYKVTYVQNITIGLLELFLNQAPLSISGLQMKKIYYHIKGINHKSVIHVKNLTA